MDGYQEREHIPTSAGRRARGERRIATRQVHEPQMLYQIVPEPDTPPVIDFAADAEIVRTVVEGEQLTYGYLFNPAFATEISLIDPLPHQRIAARGLEWQYSNRAGHRQCPLDQSRESPALVHCTRSH